MLLLELCVNKSLNHNGNTCLRDAEFCHQFLLLQGILRLPSFVSVFESRGRNMGVGSWGAFEDRNLEVAFFLNQDGSMIA